MLLFWVNSMIFGGRSVEIIKKKFGKEEGTVNNGAIEYANVQEFMLIDVESLALDDEFMKCHVLTEGMKETKALIKEAIEKGIKNFYRPKCDPSFTEGEGICFVEGKMPAVEKSYEWWVKVAKEFSPEHNSRIGTKLEYAAFMGVLIKQLVEDGKSPLDAWEMVCDASQELGHYWNSPNAKEELEPTGSREIFGMCDLANTWKMVAEEEGSDNYLIAAGGYDNNGVYSPLSQFILPEKCWYDNLDGVGWVIIS